jgi:hypothetical protein
MFSCQIGKQLGIGGGRIFTWHIRKKKGSEKEEYLLAKLENNLGSGEEEYLLAKLENNLGLG